MKQSRRKMQKICTEPLEFLLTRTKTTFLNLPQSEITQIHPHLPLQNFLKIHKIERKRHFHHKIPLFSLKMHITCVFCLQNLIYLGDSAPEKNILIRENALILYMSLLGGGVKKI